MERIQPLWLYGSLTDVFIRKFMAKPYSLWLVLNGLAVHYGRTKLLYNGFVNGVALAD